MATYNKKLKTLEIHLMLDGANPITIVDTADDNKATRALNEFKNYETMHYKEDQGGEKITRAIPYESVQYIKVTEADASVTKADPYGCESGGNTVTLTIKGGQAPSAGIKIKVAKGSTIGDSAELAEISRGICQTAFVGWEDSSHNLLPSNYVLNEDMDIVPLCN